VEDILTSFAERRGEAGIFLDYDGTLSDIVPRPDQARPAAGVAALLEQLAREFRFVSVVSGRATPELADWLGPKVDIWGVHGAQHSVGGRTEWSPSATPHLEKMTEVRDAARAALRSKGLPEDLVEDKDLVVALHYRAAADPDAAQTALEQIANDLAEEFGVVRADGRKVIELRPPVEMSKASVILDKARELDFRAVLFAGDDLVDLPAFDAVDELSRAGALGVKVAVDSPEAPKELIRRADLVVDGPRGLVELLSRLTAT
jgi:trehalose 6-phosphate phosphatase